MSQKKYWSGNTRLISDLFWSTCLACLLSWKEVAALFYGSLEIENVAFIIGDILGETLMFFFVVFFWSWHPEHLQCRTARTVIHLLFYMYLLMAFFVVIPYAVQSCNTTTPTTILFLAIVITWVVAIIRKYLRLISNTPQNTAAEETTKVFSTIGTQEDKATRPQKLPVYAIRGAKFLLGGLVLYILIMAGLSIYIQSKKPANIYEAIAVCNAEQVVKFLADGSDPNSANPTYQELTPLMLAAAVGDPKIVQILLDHGGNPNQPWAQKRLTATYVAATNNNYDCLKLLLEHNPDQDISGMFSPILGKPILKKISHAAPELQAAVKEILLSRQEDLSEYSFNEIMETMKKNKLSDPYKTLEILLNYSAAQKNYIEIKGLIIALFTGDPKIVELFLQKAPPQLLTGIPLLLGYILKCKYTEKQNTIPSNGLEYASWVVANLISKEDINSYVDLFLKYGTNPDLKDPSGMTPLMLAAQKNDYEVMKKLLAHGANPNIANKDGLTSLMLTKDPHCAQLLLDNGADTSLKNTRGETAFWKFL